MIRTNYKIYIQIIIIITTILLILTILHKYIKNNNTRERFYNDYPQTTAPNMERTRLYGSLFLDNLDEVIINMTNPPVQYDTKRIDIIKYSDVLL